MNENDNPTGSAGTAAPVPSEVGLPAQNTAPLITPDAALQKLPQDIADLGKRFANMGILNFVRGLAITNQMETAKLMQALGPQINKSEKKQRKKPSDYAAMARLTDSFSRLSFQLSQSGCLLLEIEKLSPSSTPETRKALVPTFEVGERVQIAAQTVSKPGV